MLRWVPMLCELGICTLHNGGWIRLTTRIEVRSASIHQKDGKSRRFNQVSDVMFNASEILVCISVALKKKHVHIRKRRCNIDIFPHLRWRTSTLQ